MLLHRFNSICIILGASLCRADSQRKKWAAGGEGAKYLHLLGLPDFVLEFRKFLQGV